MSENKLTGWMVFVDGEPILETFADTKEGAIAKRINMCPFGRPRMKAIEADTHPVVLTVTIKEQGHE